MLFFRIPGNITSYWIVAVMAAMTVSVQAQVDRTEFDETMKEWKSTYTELLETWTEFATCEEWESAELRDRFLELKKQGDALKLRAIEQAAAIYLASERNIEEFNRMLTGLPLKLFDQHQYGTAARVGQALLRHDPNNQAMVFDAIKAAFFSNQYELASQLVEKWKQEFGPIPEQLTPIEMILPDYLAAWQKEQEKQKSRDSGQPLPRIQFDTPKGKIVVELFEDDFPAVVNNLINLIEVRSLYRGFAFFEVLEHQAVRSGCPRNDGSTMLPVAALNPDIMESPGRHFRGTFSLFINGRTGQTTTQFVISRIPMPVLDGRNLVIGRVVEGMDTVDRLTATMELDDDLVPVPIEGAQPDTIEMIQVLQKRDHAYTLIEDP